MSGANGIKNINEQVLEDIEDVIILKTFSEAKLSHSMIQKLIDENIETQRQRAKMK